MKNVDWIIRAVDEGRTLDIHMIWELIENEHYAVLNQLLSTDPDIVMLKDSLGETLLMKCATIDNECIAWFLLSSGSPVDEADNRGFTALHHAVIQRRAMLVEILLAFGADIDKKVTKYITPLSLAVGDERMVDILRWYNPRLVFKSRKRRRNMLIQSTRSNHNKFIEELLELDEYVELIDDFDEFGRTALMYSAENDNWFIAKTLLHKGASMSIRDKLGMDAYLMAALNGSSLIVSLLIRSGYVPENINLTDKFGLDYPNAIFAAFKRPKFNFHLIKILISNGKSVLNQTDRHGNSILHLAVDRGLDLLVKELLESGIDKEIINSSAQTALDLAVNNKDLNIVYYLIDHKANYIMNTLEGVIFRGNTKEMIALLKCNHTPNKIDIRSTIGDPDKSYVVDDSVICESLWSTDLGVLIQETIAIPQKEVVYLALGYAIEAEHFKIIHQICDAGFTNVLEDWIKDTLPRRLISLDMEAFLGRFVTVPKMEINRLRMQYHSLVKKSSDALLQMTFSEFLYQMLVWKVEGTDINDLQYGGENILQVAVRYRREDMATLLLQYGVKPALDERYVDMLKSHFTGDFIKLYDESRGINVETLQDAARVAARCNRRRFNAAWKRKGLRRLLQFRSKSYDPNFIDIHGYSALNIALRYNNREIIRLLMSEGADSIAYGLLIKERSGNASDVQWSNPLFTAIEQRNCKELDRLIRCENIDVNAFYDDEMWNALHYAISLGNLGIVQFLINLGAVNLRTREDRFSCVELAYIFEHFDIVDYLMDLNQMALQR